MKNVFRILYLYQEESGFDTIKNTLQNAGVPFEEKSAKTKEEFKSLIESFIPDIILSEQNTSVLLFNELQEILKAEGLKIPFIHINDQFPIQQVTQLIKSGASDYVSKDHLERLPVAIELALQKQALEQEREHYIQKLKTTEKHFRALIEHAVDAVVILNTEGKPIYASPSIKRVLGYTEQEALDLCLYKVVHPDDLPMIRERMQECLKNPGISLPGIQCRCLHKKGNWVWYEGTITNMLHDPAVNGIVDNFHEITDKKKAELELKESEEKYRSFFENSMDAILLTVPDGQILAANPAACRMFQMTEEEVCKEGRDGLVQKDELLEKSLEERKINGKVKSQLTFRRKNGSLFQGEISSAIFSDGHGSKRTSMIICDISERVKAEKQLQVSQENYKYLFEYSTSPKWIFDLETDQILEVNQTAIETYGYSREELLNMVTRDLKPPEELERLKKVQSDLKNRQGLIHFGIYTQVKKDGTKIKAEVSGHKVTYKNRPCMVIDSFDVTERESTLAQLKDSEEKLITAQRIARLGYWKFDLANFQIYWSDEVYHIFGVEKETFTPSLEKLMESIHPEDRENYYKSRMKTFHQVADHEYIYRIISPEGVLKWIHEKGKFVKNPDGAPIVFEGTAQDITSQKLLEQSLKESNLRYQMISKATSDAIWDWDFTTKMAFRGEGFETIFGYDPKELQLPEFWESNIHENDRERVLTNIEVAIKNHQINWSMEYRFRKADNSYAYVLDRGFFIRDENGKALKLAGGMQDITKRKELEELLDKITSLAQIGSYELNFSNNSIYLSPITLQILELAEGAMPSIDEILDFYKKSSSGEMILNSLQEAIEKGKPFDLELKILTAKGTQRWVRFVGQSEVSNDKIIKLFGSIQNIDERKKNEEELRISNERYDIVSKATHDSIWDWDLVANKVLRPGKTLESILGYEDTAPFEVDSFWRNHIPEEDWNRITKTRNALFEDPVENYWEGDYRFLKPDGTYAIINDRGYIIRNTKGKAVKMIGASRDISKLKETELQLKVLNEQLEARAKELEVSNQELEQFAYVASHDLQEPLRMVSNFLMQIEKKYADILDERGKSYIHFAVDGAKRMRQMILDLLEFSRSGRKGDVREEVDLNILVKNILNLHQKQIQETKAIVKTSELPRVAVDQTAIRQVFQNLISNSLKYNQLSKGVIPEILITAKDLGDCWQFEVKDNGIGIERQYFERIFIIFQRLHDRSQYSGTGIGLAITKKLIESLEGKIWIESEPGKGTSFFFTIPVKPN